MPLEIDGIEFKDYNKLKTTRTTARFSLYKPVPYYRKTADGKQLSRNASHSFSTEYQRMLPDGGSETVRYYTNKVQRGTKEKYIEYTPSHLMLENDEMQINLRKNKDLYWFMVNHPDSQTNPLYEKDGKTEDQILTIESMLSTRIIPFQFFEVQPAKNSQKAFDIKIKKAQVLTLLADPERFTNDHVKIMYKAYNYAESDDLIMSGDYATMRLRLSEAAEANPDQFLKFYEDNTLNLKARINDAVHHGVIVFESGKVRFHNTTKEYGKSICAIPEEDWEKKEDYLREWLKTNKKGVEVAEAIKDEISAAKLGKERKVSPQK